MKNKNGTLHSLPKRSKQNGVRKMKDNIGIDNYYY